MIKIRNNALSNSKNIDKKALENYCKINKIIYMQTKSQFSTVTLDEFKLKLAFITA